MVILRDLILFCLAEAEDYFSTYRKSLLWLKNMNCGYADNYLDRYLLRNKLVTVSEKDNLRLLSLGRERLRDKFPLSKWRKRKWDGNWRVVIYDIPEKQRIKRDILRKWLKRFGFGQWQISVWITPHPIEEEANVFFDEVGLGGKVDVYLSKRISGVLDRDFAEEIWQLNRLNRKYRTYLNTFQNKRRREYLELLIQDPMLPKELLPADWNWEGLMKKCLTKF